MKISKMANNEDWYHLKDSEIQQGTLFWKFNWRIARFYQFNHKIELVKIAPIQPTILSIKLLYFQ